MVSLVHFFSLGKNSMFSQILFSMRWVLQTEPSPVASVPSGEASKKENIITKSVEKVKETTAVWSYKLKIPLQV